MPNLPTHLSLAFQVAHRVAHPTIDTHLGSFLLGSTSPDIRVLTKSKRDQTHFAPLTIERIGTGVQGLFQTYPALADSSKMGNATKAFLSGYFTHLMADEGWILGIYRPYFDRNHPQGSEPLFTDHIQANMWDRALQLDVDKAAREEMGDMPGGMDAVRSLLNDSESGVDVGFITPENLSQWREWVTDFTTWEFAWDRLRFAARRMYQDDTGATEMVEEFLQCVPSSLERVYNKIPAEKIAAYREKVIEGSVGLIKEYLSVPESD